MGIRPLYRLPPVLQRAVPPGTSDRERDAGTLDIDKQPTTIGTVGRASKLTASKIAAEAMTGSDAQVDIILCEPEMFPSSVSPWRNSIPDPSSQRMKPPRGLAQSCQAR